MSAIEHFRETVQVDSARIIPASAGVGKVLSSDASGNATWALPGEKSVATAYRSTAQKIPNAVQTRVKLNKIIKDSGGNLNVSEGWYTVPSEGYYQVSGQVQFEAAKGFCVAIISVNGTKTLNGSALIPATAVGNASSGTGVIFCKAGDKIELIAYHESGVEEELKIDESTNRLSVTRVGEGPEGKENQLVEQSIAIGYRKAVQKIKPNEYVQVQLDTAINDPGGHISTSEHCYTVPSEGFYSVIGQFQPTKPVPAKAALLCAIIINGTEAARGNRLGGQGEAAELNIQGAGVFHCKAVDKITLDVFVGATENEIGEPTGTIGNRLQVFRVGSGPEGPVGPEGKAGEWKNLTYGPNWGGTFGGPHPAARSEGGGSAVRLRGRMETEANYVESKEVFKLPAGLIPPGLVMFDRVVFGASGNIVAELSMLESTGEAILTGYSGTIAKGGIFGLDGLTFNLT